MSSAFTPVMEPAWAALAAIDWGSQSHAWALRPSGGSIESGKLENTPEAVALWAADLRRRFAGAPIAVAIEQKRGPVVYMLDKYAHLVLYPVPPAMSAWYRRAFAPSGAKNDPADAALLLELVTHHRQRLRPLATDTAETRLLQFLVEQRRQLVQEKVRLVEQLTAALAHHFPQLRTWFDSLDKPLVLALLDRWPTLPALQRAHPGTLKRFFVDQNCRSHERIEERIRSIHAAMPAVTDEIVVEAATRKTAAILAQLRAALPQIAQYESRIAALTSDHPDAPIFASFPGAGAATVPRLIAAFGTNRDAWRGPDEMQRYSGIAPVHKSSGKSTVIAMRRACPKFIRQTFHEFAGQSIPHCQWARDYYKHHRDNLKASHHVAVRSLAFRWIRVLYRCWKDHELYNERVLLEAQRRRNSPLRAGDRQSKPAKWDKVAGFDKLVDPE